MNPAIALQTKFGYNLYQVVYHQFAEAKYEERLSEFKKDLWLKRDDAEREVLHFLNDDELTKTHKMDDNDPEGWKMWKEMSDRFSVLNYFYNRKA